MCFLRILTSLTILICPLSATAQEIAITIDDLPYVPASKTSPEEGLSYVQSINNALKTHGIIATGFVIGAQINNDTMPALTTFAEAGHTIGNHSWSHPDYNVLTIEAFREEVYKTDQVLTNWLDENRYYRFPYLKEGETEETKVAATQVLTELGYQNIPVTIDNDEWRFNRDYIEAHAEGNTVEAEKIAEEYLVHMQERTLHFQKLAENYLGRDVRHILLLHMNKINADHLHTLLDWYASEGWTFITVEEAMTDPFYSLDDIYIGPRGLSQIERVMGYASN